jgi:adenylosuccinate synthase
MVRSVVAVAYGDRLPGTLPNLRYLGVGPAPSQIIRDVPSTTALLALNRGQ